MRTFKKRPCPNPDCLDCGSSEQVIKAGKDKRGRQRFLCKACREGFSATKGTLFYRLRKPKKDFLKALAMLAERNSLAAVARINVLQGGDGGPLAGEGRSAGTGGGGAPAPGLFRHAAAVGRVVGLCAKQGWERGYPETEETGEFWKATAFDPQSKLRVARAVGKRDQDLLEKLLQQVARRVEEVPALASDQLPGYEEAIVAVCGEVPLYRGRGRPPTKRRPPPQLRYGQVVKQREGGRVVAVRERIVFGSVEESRAALGGRVSTSGVERTQLTSRQSNGRLVRKTLSFSKKREMLEWACAWEDLVYNLAHPLKTLRVLIPEGWRKWRPRTPAMAAGLTDHVWTVRELAEFSASHGG